MPFPTAENVRFFKLVSLIINVGGVVVENKLTEKVRDSGQTFEGFLNRKKHELYHFYKSNTCCLCSSKLKNEKCQKNLKSIQWKTLFTKTKRKKCPVFKGNCSCIYDANTNVKEKELDITLSVYLLINLFPLSDCEKQDLERFREQRNTYFAHITRAKLEEQDFKNKFRQVSSVIKSITSSCKIITYSEVCEEITDIENGFMQITPDDQEIINYIQETRELDTDLDVPQESVENVISTIHKGIKKKQKNQNEKTEEKTKSGDLIDERDKKTWQEEVEEMLRDIKVKFSTVNGVPLKQRRRSSLSKIANYDTLPPDFKCNELKKGKSLHEPMKTNETIDMKLCKTGSFEEIENVLKSMTDRDQFLQARDKEGFCAIHYASERLDGYTISVLRLFINHGANIADKTLNGNTVLHLACKNGNVELCKYCLSEDESILNEEDCIGWNASLYAAFYEQIETLTFLRENYQRLRITSKKTLVNILHMACLNGNNDLYLHIKDAYPDIQLNADTKGRSLLQYAARGGNREILKDLLSKKRKLEIKNDDEIKILHIACLYGHEEMCRDIISQFPDTIHARDEDGLHAVHFAAVGGHVPVVNLLMKFLKEKINQLSISSPQNINILQMACVYRKTEMWKFIAHNFSNLLLEEDDSGWGMQHVAARCGNLEVLEIIVEKNYVRDLMSKDKLGRTVLHIASLYGNYNICKYLVSQFPDLVKERDVDRCPACVLAARGGNEDAFYLLFEHSKSIISNKDKSNMYYAASLSMNGEIIHFIEEQYRDIISRIRETKMP